MPMFDHEYMDRLMIYGIDINQLFKKIKKNYFKKNYVKLLMYLSTMTKHKSIIYQLSLQLNIFINFSINLNCNSP